MGDAQKLKKAENDVNEQLTHIINLLKTHKNKKKNKFIVCF